MILLTPEERCKFAAWLRQDASADGVIVTQMKTMNVSDFLVRTREAGIRAKIFVAQVLDSIEDQTIG